MKKITITLTPGEKNIIKIKKNYIVNIFDTHIKGKYNDKNDEYDFIAKVKFIICFLNKPSIVDIKITNLKIKNINCSSDSDSTHDYCSIYDSSSSCSTTSSSIDDNSVYKILYNAIKHFFYSINISVNKNSTFIKFYLPKSSNFKKLDIQLKFYKCSFFKLHKYVSFYMIVFYVIKAIFFYLYKFIVSLFSNKYHTINHKSKQSSSLKKYTINRSSPFIDKVINSSN
jgi:hypothetical protein